jgi:hypothetical protein
MSIFDINSEDNVTSEYLCEKGFTAIVDTDIYIYCDVRGIVRYRFETEMLDLVVRDEQILMSAHLRGLNVKSTWKRSSYKDQTLMCSHHITDRGLFDMLFGDFEKMINYLKRFFGE